MKNVRYVGDFDTRAFSVKDMASLGVEMDGDIIIPRNHFMPLEDLAANALLEAFPGEFQEVTEEELRQLTEEEEEVNGDSDGQPGSDGWD